MTDVQIRAIGAAYARRLERYTDTMSQDRAARGRVESYITAWTTCLHNQLGSFHTQCAVTSFLTLYTILHDAYGITIDEIVAGKPDKERLNSIIDTYLKNKIKKDDINDQND